jgi:hypothetical protein
VIEGEEVTTAVSALPELTGNLGDELGPSERDWHSRALAALDDAGVPFLIAGAFALNHYSGLWRGTKDLDVLVLASDRDRAVEAVTAAGMRDLFPEESYDRNWIFRATRDGVIFDIIWSLANYADSVDATWLEAATRAAFLGRPVRVVSAGDLCWMKLFVMQKQRCDWPDLFNVIRGTGGRLDWSRLLEQAGPHWRLLVGLTAVYDWLCPAETHFIPDEFRHALRALEHEWVDGRDQECRANLLDSRPWLTTAGAGNPEASLAPGSSGEK